MRGSGPRPRAVIPVCVPARVVGNQTATARSAGVWMALSTCGESLSHPALAQAPCGSTRARTPARSPGVLGIPCAQAQLGQRDQQAVPTFQRKLGLRGLMLMLRLPRFPSLMLQMTTCHPRWHT